MTSLNTTTFDRTSGLVAARVHDYPGYVDIRNPGRRPEVIARYVWADPFPVPPDQPDMRLMDNHVLDFPGSGDGVALIGFEYRRLGRLYVQPPSTDPLAPPPPLRWDGNVIHIEGSHMAFPIVIEPDGSPVDVVQEEIIVTGDRCMLRAVASFRVPYPASPFSGYARLEHAFPEKTTQIYAVVGADGVWRTATNIAVTWQAGDPMHELVIYRGARA
jgi:hypothetical protein